VNSLDSRGFMGFNVIPIYPPKKCVTHTASGATRMAGVGGFFWGIYWYIIVDPQTLNPNPRPYTLKFYALNPTLKHPTS